MTIRQSLQMMTLATTCLVATTFAGAQQPAAPARPQTASPQTASPQTAALNQTIPVDPQITTGQLPNGLH